MPFTSRLSALLPQHASSFALPQLNYPINRPYRWKWLPYAAYGFMLLVLAILVPITYASQGYETVTAYKQDPNTTTIHWYHTFTGKPTPGSQCDEHVFNLGDTFSTSIGVLSYTIQTIYYNSPDGLNVFGGSTIPYKGLSTDYCDVMGITLQVGVDASVLGEVFLQCIHKDFQVSATTNVLLNDVTMSQSNSALNMNGPLLYMLSVVEDLQTQPLHIPSQNTSGTVASANVTISSSDSIFLFCPMAHVKNETNVLGSDFYQNKTLALICSPQDYSTPAIDPENVRSSGTGFSIGITDNPFVHNAIVNYMEALTSIVRYDLGNRLPNNFLVNPSAVLSQNQTFLPLAPVLPSAAEDSRNVTLAIQQSIRAGSLPLAQPFNASAPNQPAPATLSTTYACHLAVPKPVGAAIVSVVVATLSIGGSIWGLLMLTAAFFAKRNRPEANCCEYHSLEAQLPKSLNASEEHLELRGDAFDEFEMTVSGIGASTRTHVGLQDATSPHT